MALPNRCTTGMPCQEMQECRRHVAASRADAWPSVGSGGDIIKTHRVSARRVGIHDRLAEALEHMPRIICIRREFRVFDGEPRVKQPILDPEPAFLVGMMRGAHAQHAKRASHERQCQSETYKPEGLSEAIRDCLELRHRQKPSRLERLEQRLPVG